MHADDVAMDKRAAADVPKEIAEITNPMIDVPATQTTFYFVDGTAHNVTVPKDAPQPSWSLGYVVLDYRGVRTTIELCNVKYSEIRDTTMRVRKESAK